MMFRAPLLLALPLFLFSCQNPPPIPRATTIPRSDAPIHYNDPFPAKVGWVLQAPEKLDFYLLDPDHPHPQADPTFLNFPIARKIEITSSADRQKLAAAVLNSPHEYFNTALCFEPRHAISATRGGVTTDILICFSCGKMKIYIAGELLDIQFINSDQKPVFDSFATTNEPH